MNVSRTITETTVYADVRVDCWPQYPAEDRAYAIRKNGSLAGLIRTPHDHSQWGTIALEALRRLEAGEAGLIWRTQEFGDFTDAAAPPALRAWLNARNPFAVYRGLNPLPPPTLTQAEQRRAAVEAWARTHTTPRQIAEAMVSPKISTTSDGLTSRKRHVGQFERALEITATDFFASASANAWNEPAAYMEAYSRIYLADATHLSVAPTWVQGEDLIAPVYPRLIAGAARARAVVYGGAD